MANFFSKMSKSVSGIAKHVEHTAGSVGHAVLKPVDNVSKGLGHGLSSIGKGAGKGLASAGKGVESIGKGVGSFTSSLSTPLIIIGVVIGGAFAVQMFK